MSIGAENHANLDINRNTSRVTRDQLVKKRMNLVILEVNPLFL